MCNLKCSSVDPFTILVKVKNKQRRALIDTGADTVVISESYYRDIFGRNSRPRNSKLQLKSADGGFLHLLGESYISLDINGKVYPHTCLVVRNLNHSLIIGRDFMTKYNMILNFQTNTCMLGREKLTLVRNNDLLANIRTVSSVSVPPRTLITIYGKYHKNAPVKVGSKIQWEQNENCFLHKEPGLVVMNGLGIGQSNHRVPITLVNNTGRHFFVKKGNIVAKLNCSSEINEITQVNSHVSNSVKTDFAPPPEHIPEVTSPDLDLSQHKQINNLLKDNADVFAKNEFDIGKSNILKAHIETGNSKPIKRKPYRTPFAYRDEVRRQVDEMLKTNIISPCNSKWSAPILCVKKKSGEIRICCDYRDLNRVTETFYWPLPNVESVFSCLGNAKYFSSLDFIKGYHQIEVDEASKPKTAFVCEEGLYQYNVMPFRLTCAPSIFQENMTHLLNGLNNFAIAYLDDVIVFSETFEDHLCHLNQVFDRLRKANMKLKSSKCEFLKPELHYLGHIISNKGELKVDNRKIETIQNLVPPSNVKGVRSFIGMVSYYRKFIPNFSQIAEPLTNLTRKDVEFNWTLDHQNSFDKLKQAISSPPVLHLPVRNKPFSLFTDASQSAIGAVLTQEIEGQHRPVYFLSHHLNKTQQNWPIIEKECYAIIFALEKFRPYLEGTKFNIFSDHNPLKFIDSANNKNAKLQKWAIKISSFGGTIHYIKGKDNVCADFLSRLEHSPSEVKDICAVNTDRLIPGVKEGDSDDDDHDDPETPLNQSLDFVKEQQKDRKIVSITKSLNEQGEKSKFCKQFVFKDNLLYHVNKDEEIRLIVPKSLQQSIIKEIHEGFSGRHIGRDKTYEHIRSRFYWKGMASDVYLFISKCITCNTQNLKVEPSPLQDTPIARYPFQRIGIDTTGRYPVTADGNKFCLTCTDHYSGWVELFPIPDKSAMTICNVLLNQVFNRYGWPRYIISDNGSEFVNELLSQLTKLGHVHHIKTSIYHPRANARAERPHRTIHETLAKVAQRDKWDEYIPSIQAALNFSESASRRKSPYFLLFHRDPLIPIDTLFGSKEEPIDDVNDDEFLPAALGRVRLAQKLVRKRLKQNQDRNRKYVTKKSHAKDRHFEVGDPVYLFNFNRKDKFDKRWLPNYRIISQSGPVSFVVQNQVTGKTHRVHSDALRLARVEHWPDENDDSSSLESTEDSTVEETGMSSEDTSDESSANQDSDTTVIYTHNRNHSRQAKENAKAKIKYCRSLKSK